MIWIWPGAQGVERVAAAWAVEVPELCFFDSAEEAWRQAGPMGGGRLPRIHEQTGQVKQKPDKGLEGGCDKEGEPQNSIYTNSNRIGTLNKCQETGLVEVSTSLSRGLPPFGTTPRPCGAARACLALAGRLRRFRSGHGAVFPGGDEAEAESPSAKRPAATPSRFLLLDPKSLLVFGHSLFFFEPWAIGVGM